MPTVPKGPDSFAGGVAALGGGAMVAHLVAFASAPVIHRLFGPEAFGQATVFICLLTFAGIVVSLRYEAALMLPANDAEAANLLVLACLAVTILSGASCLVVGLFGDAVAKSFNAEVVGQYKWLLPVGIFVAGLGLSLRAWSTRHRHFRRLGLLSAAETSVLSAARITAGAVRFVGPGCLVITYVVARAVPAGGLLIKLVQHDLGFVIRACRWRRMTHVARRYIRFPLLDSFSALLGPLSYTIVPPLLLGASLGSVVVGHYSRALLLGQLPFLLLGRAIEQTFYQKAAAEYADKGHVGELIQQVLPRLIWITLLPMAWVGIFGPDIFQVVLGRPWAQAGLYAQLLAGWLFLAGLAIPLTGLIRVLDRLGYGLLFHAARVAMQIAGLIVGGWVLADPFMAILLLALAGALVDGLLCLYVLYIAGAMLTAAGKPLLRYTLYAVPALVIAFVAKWVGGLSAVGVVVVMLAASGSYVVLILRHDRWARSKVSEVIGRLRWRR